MFAVGDRVRRLRDHTAAHNEVYNVYAGEVYTVTSTHAKGGGQSITLEGKGDYTYSSGNFDLAPPEVDQDSPLRVGDKVRLVGKEWGRAHYPGVGAVVTVESAENGRPWASDGANGLTSNSTGEPYPGFEFEVVERYVEPEPERLQPQVGGQVKLTGSQWTDPYNVGYVPNPRKAHDIVVVDSENLVRIDGGWTVYLDPESYQFTLWGGEVVAEAPVVQHTPEPLSDWERELLEGPKLDSTGYPVGTPRSAKDVPSTQQIKGTYQDVAETDNAAERSALLAEFNRWYEQEIAEFKAEGYAEGYEAARAELEASLPQTAFVVIVGPFEEFADIDGAEDRINELVDNRQYATILQTVLDPDTGHTVGFQVKAPSIGSAEPGTII